VDTSYAQTDARIAPKQAWRSFDDFHTDRRLHNSTPFFTAR